MTASLSTGIKLSYGVGQVAEGLKNTAMATFVLFYYNQVLGLPGTLAGLALGIALVFDALTDPLAGSVSDNISTRLGRRHPFIYASAVPLAVAFFLLFFPPAGLGPWTLFAWLTVTVILTRAAMTLFHVPHIALGAELTDDYEERTTVVSYRYFFSMFGMLMVYVLGFGIFFSDARGGQVAAENYAPFGLSIAVLMLVTVVWTGWGTRHRIPFLRQNVEPSAADSPREMLMRMFRDTGRALANRTFRWLFGGVLILFVMIGVDSALNLYMFNYFWELDSTRTLWMFLALPIGALVGAPLTRYLHRYMSKHATVLLGTGSFAFFQVLPVVLRLAGVFPENDDPALVPLLLGLRFLMGVAAMQSTVSFNSMMADIADLHELETNRRQEGIFFGAISFSAKATSGLGNVVAGVGLDIIEWPRGADVRTAADVASETIDHLGILYGPLVSVFALVALWCLSHYDLTRQRHAQIQAELAERRRRAEAKAAAVEQVNGA